MNIYRKIYDVLHGVTDYRPQVFETPRLLMYSETSAWKGLELILKDIILKSKIKTEKCLEFGVEFGYSTVALSNYFDRVIGVDIFTGDIHAGFNGDIFDKVKKSLSSFENIQLLQKNYKEYTKQTNDRFDLIHVDIVHTYEDTFECGLWSALHSDCTLFHDTESFPEVKKAVIDISKRTKKRYYNYKLHNGLGILY